MQNYYIRLKKVTALALSVLMLVGTLSTAAPAFSADGYIEDFENADLNSFTISKDGGVTIKQAGDNHYLNISPKTDGIAAFAEYAISCDEKVPAEFSYRFRINSFMQSGQTIAHISKSGVPSIVIETCDGGIAYKNTAGEYVKFIDSAIANKWYDIYIRADYSKSTFSVRLDGEDLLKGIPMLNSATGVDKISFRAKYSPGIGIDDFSAGVKQDPGDIQINGEANINLANNTAADVDYVVAVYDTNDAAIDSPDYSVTVLPAASGVTVTKNGRIATLHISKDAAEGDYTLRAIYGSAVRNFHVKLSRYSAQVENLVLSGPGRVAYIEDKENTYTYTVAAYDQNGRKIDAVDVNFFMQTDSPDTISINPQTGVMTVSGALTNNTKTTVFAECVSDSSIYASKTILLQDAATYQGDETRFSILLDYIDRARELGRDPYNGSILLAKAIDRYTMKPAIWKGLEYDFVPSNLAEQGNWFRSMQGLYNLTGDEQYKREIDETYDMYLENYIYDNGTISMGGHICIDMQTLLPHHGYGVNFMELKTHFPYLDPFWEKDPEAARKFSIMFWEGAVTNWQELDFNRHIDVYDSYTEANWNNLTNLWKKPTSFGNSPLWTNSLSFCETAGDLVQLAAQLYKHTGEEPAREWARRILYQYWASTDPKTKINTYTFSSRYRYQNNYDYSEIPEYWWLRPGVLSIMEHAWYGDLFYVQCYDDMVSKGIIEAVDRSDTTKVPSALYPFYRDSVVPDTLPAYSNLELAEIYGFDSETGRMILDYMLNSLKSLYIYGNYSVDDNSIDYLFVDGTSLNGYVVERDGYFIEKGNVMERFEADSDFTLANLKTYLTCKDVDEFKDQLYYVWQFVRGAMAYNGFGEAGITAPGDNVKLDFSSECNDPRFIIAFCQLYDATGNTDYLDMARHVANNVVKNNMVDGLFTYQPDSHYIEIAGRNGVYPYAFALLEATVRGESDLMPQYYVYQGYYEDRGILENTGERRTNLHDVNIWNRYNVTPVHITDIIVPEEEITLKVGEEKFLGITFLPDDATNTAVRITSSDSSCVSVDAEGEVIRAEKAGNVEIRIISENNRLLKKTIKVTVE